MADTLEIFGVEYTNVAGIIAKDDNGDDQTYIKGGSDFNVTLTQDSTEKWIPNRTYAEIVTAYNDGKNITFTAGYPAFRAGFDSYDEFGGTITYYVDESFSIDFTDNGLNIKYYSLHGNGNVTISSSEVYHITTNANAQPSDVGKDKVFYNANGYQVGTATGSTPILQSKNKSYTPTETAQTETVSADSGYDGLEAVNITVNAMPSGTAGTPTATKGAVSNHSVSVTPSVTNQTGYITGSTKTGTAVTVSASELVSGSETKTSNGTYDVTNLAELVVNVSSSSPTIQSLTVTPTTSQQTFNASGVDGYKPVTVAAMPTMTLPTSAASSATSGYTSKATIGRSTAAQYINIPPGYNSAGAYYVISAVANGSATAPASISGTAASVSTGTNTLTLTKTVSVTPTVSAGYVSSGTAGNSSVSLTASVTTKAAATITPTTTNQTIAAGTYLTGTQTIAGDADLVGSNILSTANIFGVQGTVDFIDVYIRSTAPTSSVGSDGDIYIQE